ncbi:response regulator, partial [Magnetofaba australis]|uniref:response regulator n=1 Tax=Magnetofaba australis TaxID=1472297 RepID=UPI00117F888A
MSQALKVMVVDDTITYRMIMKKVAETIPGIMVVASAPNGKVALEKIQEDAPDVVLLDVEMPVMDGLTTLKEISRNHKDVTVVMVSGVSRSNANIIVECLNAGALDFVTKPLETNAERAKQALRLDLEPILKVVVAKSRGGGKSLLRPTPGAPSRDDAPEAEEPETAEQSAPTPRGAPALDANARLLRPGLAGAHKGPGLPPAAHRPTTARGAPPS